jgi:hypothetical protein
MLACWLCFLIMYDSWLALLALRLSIIAGNTLCAGSLCCVSVLHLLAGSTL